MDYSIQVRHSTKETFVISTPSNRHVFPFPGAPQRGAHMAWGARVALRRPPRNRLNIGARREGTVSDDILETRRLTRTDGGDPAYICSGARRGGTFVLRLG